MAPDAYTTSACTNTSTVAGTSVVAIIDQSRLLQPSVVLKLPLRGTDGAVQCLEK